MFDIANYFKILRRASVQHFRILPLHVFAIFSLSLFHLLNELCDLANKASLCAFLTRLFCSNQFLPVFVIRCSFI